MKTTLLEQIRSLCAQIANAHGSDFQRLTSELKRLIEEHERQEGQRRRPS